MWRIEFGFHRALARVVPATALVVLALALSACEPAYAPPDAPGIPCPQISAAEYDAAIKAGATRATATISADGIVSMETEPGTVQCATFRSSMRPCRRPNDFVIRYTLANAQIVHVRVPAGEQYRFRVQAQPTPCEIVTR
ncbi:MAG: hypothetical protein FJ009_12775 [Chloroflexi bacterium]|nr:hypothetical protein [Chloroflexota bacterium]